MVIWRRLGWLVPFLFALALVLTQVIADLIGGEGFYVQNEWMMAVGLFFSCALIWVVGSSANAKAETNGEPTHTLFYVQMQNWAIILAAISVVMLFIALTS